MRSDMEIDVFPVIRTVNFKGKKIELPEMEFRVFMILYDSIGSPVKTQRLVKLLKHRGRVDPDVSPPALKTLISRLRRRLPCFNFQNKSKLGYRMESL